MSGKRQKTQYSLALEPLPGVKPRSAITKGRTIGGEASTRKPGLAGPTRSNRRGT